MKKAQEKIYSILKDIASQVGAKDTPFLVEIPKDKAHGDLAANIALAIFADIKNKKLNIKNPLELAEEIVRLLTTDHSLLTDFDKIEAVSPGFINFYFSQKFLTSQVQNIINEGADYGSSKIGAGKKASVEFVSANPTGPLHIGNARGGPLGDTIANVLSRAGYKVTREYLHNDVGGQVTKLGEAIYYLLFPEDKPKDYELQYQGDYVKELANEVASTFAKASADKESLTPKRAGEIAVEIMLREIFEDCEKMGIKFDRVTRESELRKEVAQVLEKIKNSLKEKDGALWFAPNDEFLKDRETVVKKSDGEYTYFASDIAYHDQKMSQNDTVIDILGSNHSGHVPRLQAVIKALGFDVKNFRVVLYQFVRLKRGKEAVKMSKRAGNIVTAREVLDEVGKDAFRFFLLTPASNTHMDFDLELAKKRASENPVFYVQYAYTRMASIFAKVKSQKSKVKSEEADLSLLKTKEETDLIRTLLQFPVLVEKVAKSLEINAFCSYALEIATLFHKFYEAHKVISDDQNLTNARLALLKASQITLKNTLDLLGVSAPEKM